MDIGSGSIKVVELKKGKEGIELTRADLIELSPILNDEKSEGNKGGMKEALEKALGEREAIKGKAVSIATHGPAVYIRYVKLPPVDITRIAQIVNYEAQQQVPLPLEEVIWDYQVLKRKVMDINVVLVATKSELIKNILEEIAPFQIEPEIVDYGPLAFYNCLKFNQELSREEASILLDMGAKSTDMSIEREGHLCWTRSIPVGGHDLTQAIQQSFGLGFAEAERMKRQKEIVDLGDEKKKFTQVIVPVLSRLVNDIERSLAFFRAELGGKSISRILLSGGGAELVNLDKFLEKELGIEVKKVSPLGNIRISNGFPLPGRESSFTVAIGLALRPLVKCASEVSLLPIEIARKKEFQKKKRDFILSFILALLIAGMAYVFAVRDYGLRKNRLEAIEEELKKYQRYEEPIKVLKGEIGASTKKLETLRDLTSGRAFWLEVILELSRLVPDEVKLNSFSQEKGILTLEGEAPTVPDISDFVSLLESAPLFGKVEVGTPERVTGEEEFYRFSFRVPLESFPFPREKVKTRAPERGRPRERFYPGGEISPLPPLPDRYR